jgi:hypothetical protein
MIMAGTLKLTTQQIGKLGELYVQFRLLSFGIESAPLTTDSGIDLVAYSPGRTKAFTIQVKTNLKPKPGGGKGKPALDWWVPDDSPAELFALVDVSENRIWLFTPAEIKEYAQQQSNGRFHLYMHIEPGIKRRANSRPALIHQFEGFKLENRIGSLL